MDINSKFAHFSELYLPYKFKLLLRGSQDGFSSKEFHELCNNKPITVTFIKVKGTEEILGGYNPLIWKSSSSHVWGEWGKTKDSFIFSFKNKSNFFKDVIISNVENINYAIRYHDRFGPFFGGDIIIYNRFNESTDYDFIKCIKYYYEKKIRDTVDYFSMEDYEVFQIVKR